ncbi:MAG: 4-alpha-glucanotransferase [Planctomycetaceae bacterium]|nr:4-alpha-glucanotransferase [Planctomycetaceae bacterium]
MGLARSSGVLLPVFSLPGDAAIGDFGAGAREFVDFLHQAGQTYWQLLPLGPPAKGDSPYSCYSAFAGNPLYVDVRALKDAGFLPDETIIADGSQEDRRRPISYSAARAQKLPLLRQSYEYFCRCGTESQKQKFEDFCQTSDWWLEDFARFDALSQHLQQPDWSQWESGLVHRDPDILAHWDQVLAVPIREAKYLQFLFDWQWSDLKAYANSRGVQVYGDMPIFVAYESADVWARQDLFWLDESGRSTVVAGVPPDYFSATGQMWGNPLYRWDRLADTGYRWWTDRIQHALQQFDLLRIDHFRAFESYWEIPADAPNAIGGQWKPGPGTAPFDAARTVCGDHLRIVAEDLGLITAEVHHLRDQLGFPGMRVLQFGFSSEEDGYHRPECYPENSVAYTGTHDNDTLMGWLASYRASHGDHALLRRYVADDAAEPQFDLIRAVFNSAASTAIVPFQDLLGLGSEARMNTPGEPDGNWHWRCQTEWLSDELAQRLRQLTQESGRLCLEG